MAGSIRRNQGRIEEKSSCCFLLSFILLFLYPNLFKSVSGLSCYIFVGGKKMVTGEDRDEELIDLDDEEELDMDDAFGGD